MICRCSMVFLLSFMQQSVLSDRKAEVLECGKNKQIPIHCTNTLTCNPDSKVTKMALLKKKVPLLETNVIAGELHCGKDKKFCFLVSNDRKPTLIVNSVTFKDEDSYELHIHRSGDVHSRTIDLSVTGICEPVLSSSKDELTCKVDVKNSTLKITWMDTNHRIYKTEDLVDSSEVRSSLRLMEETRNKQMCCSVSYGKEEKKSCTKILSNPEMSTDRNEGTDSKKPIILILCLTLFLAIVVLYMTYRYCRRQQIPNRGTEKENPEEGVPFPLARPQDKV